MPAQRNQRTTRPAAPTRAESATAGRGNGNGRAQQPGRLLACRAVHRDRHQWCGRTISTWARRFIPIHILNLVCAVHLRQEHGFKRWQISRFKETYPPLVREDGTVALVRLIKPPGVTDHLDA